MTFTNALHYISKLKNSKLKSIHQKTETMIKQALETKKLIFTMIGLIAFQTLAVVATAEDGA